MNRTMLSLAVGMAVSCAAAPAAAQLKIAVIDVQRVVTESDPGKEALRKLKTVQDQKIEQGRGLQQELDTLRDQFQKQRFTLSEEKIEEINKAIEDKSIALKRFEDDAQRELTDARRRTLGALEEKILPVINTIGQERGLTLIFNKFQSGLVFADDSIDITDDVIRRFNTSQ